MDKKEYHWEWKKEILVRLLWAGWWHPCDDENWNIESEWQGTAWEWLLFWQWNYCQMGKAPPQWSKNPGEHNHNHAQLLAKWGQEVCGDHAKHFHLDMVDRRGKLDSNCPPFASRPTCVWGSCALCLWLQQHLHLIFLFSKVNWTKTELHPPPFLSKC